MRPWGLQSRATLVLAVIGHLCGACSLLFDSNAPPPNGECEQTLSISADVEDGEVGVIGTLTLLPQGELGIDLEGIYMGAWSGFRTAGYFRFALPEGLAAGERLRYATLRLWGQNVDSWNFDTDQLRIQLENVADAQAVTNLSRTPDDEEAEPMISPAQLWPEDGGLEWIVNDFNDSPNLAPMLSALVEQQGGINPGAHVIFWVAGDFNDGEREVATLDFSAAEAEGRQAQLVLSRCAN